MHSTLVNLSSPSVTEKRHKFQVGDDPDLLLGILFLDNSWHSEDFLGSNSPTLLGGVKSSRGVIEISALVLEHPRQDREVQHLSFVHFASRGVLS